MGRQGAKRKRHEKKEKGGGTSAAAALAATTVASPSQAAAAAAAAAEQLVDGEDDALVDVVDASQTDVLMAEAGAGPALAKRCAKRDTPARLMRWLVAPVSLDEFAASYYEFMPLHVKRGEAGYLDGLLTIAELRRWLKEGKFKYRQNVDVVRFDAAKGRKVNVNGAAGTTADAAEVWRNFKEQGCSLRVLHPQRWSDSLHLLLHVLERHWNCAVGCNAYLTPAGSQGFAPHSDDVDVFVLQLEGTKAWRIYPPQAGAQELWPRVSSRDFKPQELPTPQDVNLQPGDLLYLPRGTIHEATSSSGEHSLHITVSTGHRTTWADFLHIALDGALAMAAEEEPELRRNVPSDAMNHLGIVHSEVDGAAPDEQDPVDNRREELIDQMRSLCATVLSHLPVDAAADAFAARFQAQRLPPPDAAEQCVPVRKAAGIYVSFGGCARLALEDDFAMVYHPFENQRLLHMEHDDDAGAQQGCLQFNVEVAPALEMALVATPQNPLTLRDAVKAAEPDASAEDVASALQTLCDAGICKTTQTQAGTMAPSPS